MFQFLFDIFISVQKSLSSCQHYFERNFESEYHNSDKMRKIQQRHKVPIEDLDFLASKFLLIIPQHLHGDRARIGFQLEKAFWRYINQFDEEKVARMENYFQLKDFALQIFPRVPFLRDHVDIVEEVIADFMDYKRSVPTYGVILLNSTLDKVLLVQSYKRKAWGFPKGKVNENERGEVCAAREAEEEIGLNVDELLDPDTWCEQVCFNFLPYVLFVFVASNKQTDHLRYLLTQIIFLFSR